MQDEDTGRIIIGNGRTEFSKRNGAHVPCDFTLTVEIEDGRERLTFDNWIGQRGDFKGDPEPVTDEPYSADMRAKLQRLAGVLD